MDIDIKEIALLLGEKDLIIYQLSKQIEELKKQLQIKDTNLKVAK